MSRICTVCNILKDYNQFHKSKKGKDGYTEQCKSCRSTKSSLKYKNNIQEYRKRNRKSYYKNVYKISTDVYDNMYQSQGGKCAICKEQYSLLRLDHDHATGNIRELLCHNCNVGLGHFKDSIHLLNTAIGYLIKHDKTKQK